MNCACEKISNLFCEEAIDTNTFLCLNKEKILNSNQLMSALFNQYKNYLYKSARKVAMRYPSVELEELISEGFEGLLRALEKYDCKESSFLTYAQHWVRMKMFSAARKSIGIMALPGSMYAVISKVKQVLDKMPYAGYKEIAITIHESEARVAAVLDLIKSPKVGGVSTLEDYVTYEDNLNTNYENSLENCLEDLDFQKRFWAIVESLVTPKECFVLGLLFGRGGEMRRSLEWVAKVLFVSKERIRQIKETAFDKLRISDDIKALTLSEK